MLQPFGDGIAAPILHKMRSRLFEPEGNPRAREKGIRAVVATGRSMAEGQHGAEAIGADGYMITLAGAQIMDRQTGREIYARGGAAWYLIES